MLVSSFIDGGHQFATHSLIHKANVAATRPVRSVTSYPYLISSVNASMPAPAAPVAVAVRTATLALDLVPRLEEPDGPVEYRWGDGRWNLACRKNCERQLVHVQGMLLVRRLVEVRERGFILAAIDGTLGGREVAAWTIDN